MKIKIIKVCVISNLLILIKNILMDKFTKLKNSKYNNKFNKMRDNKREVLVIILINKNRN